jgi:peptide/nickel transport system ATP-binding protein
VTAMALGSEPETDGALLDVEDLHTGFRTPRGLLRAVDGVSFSLRQGRTLGVVGESGSGKTVLARSIMGLLPRSTVVRSGTVRLGGRDLSALRPRQLEDVWGREIAIVLQDPMTSLNPVLRVGTQITESLRRHLHYDRAQATATAVDLLRSMGIPEPERRLRDYPHQLSGGMRQRVTIAIALACGPRLLLADEPTTALDVTVQAQILDLLTRAQQERHMAMVLITHDLGVVAGRTDDIIVMYAGQVVEHGPTEALFTDMKMPYTEALMKSIPRLSAPSHTPLVAISGRPPDLVDPPPGCRFSPRCPYARDRCHDQAPPLMEASPGHWYACWYPVSSDGGRLAETALDPGRQAGHSGPSPMTVVPPPPAEPPEETDLPPQTKTSSPAPLAPTPQLHNDDDRLLSVEHLVVEFPAGHNRKVHAVSDVSFDLARGETLGLVGESGCGKSTTGRAILAMPRPTAGTVHFEGLDVSSLSEPELRRLRPRMQMIFQDPTSSLNPRRRVEEIITEPLAIWGREVGVVGRAAQRDKLVEVMDAVGLDYAAHARRRPHEFSGGQCQRISIARALMLDPQLIICDEPVSALDVSIQAQIINLLEDMKSRYGLTLMFIAHDLAVVKNVSDRVAVMYLGKLCELAPADRLYSAPAHPYTTALLDSIPVADPERPTAGDKRISGEVPSPVSPPSGCRFRTRCPRAQDRCAHEEPTMREVGPDHFVACHFPVDAPAGDRG